MSGVNSARGEVSITINGQHYVLCLTLGALAHIETALETSSQEELSARLRKLSAADVLLVLEALLMGGGNPVQYQVLQGADIQPTEAAIAIANTFALAAQGL